MAPFTLVGKLQGFAFNSERLEDGGFHADFCLFVWALNGHFLPILFLWFSRFNCVMVKFNGIFTDGEQYLVVRYFFHVYDYDFKNEFVHLENLSKESSKRALNLSSMCSTPGVAPS